MAELETTDVGSPISVPTPRKVRTSAGGTMAAIAQAGQLAVKAGKILADEDETAMKLQAQNDLINDTINPDLQQHKSAYAYTVGQGQALQQHNVLVQEITNGVYDEVSPEDFQKLLKEKHVAYYDTIAGNDTAKFSRDAYNAFTLKNQTTLTAAQAGKHRVKLGEKQGEALYGATSLMAKEPQKHTATDILEEVYDAKYSLLQDKHRRAIAFSAASEIARDTGNSQILEDLNDELSFDVDPQLRSAYDATMAAAQVTNEAFNQKTRFDTYNDILTWAEEGSLTWAIYKSHVVDNPASHDLNDKPLMTDKEFVNLMHKSNLAYDRKVSQDKYDEQFMKGTLSMGTPTKYKNASIAAAHETLINEEGATRESVAAKMGSLVNAVEGNDPYYSDLSSRWGSINPYKKDGTPDEQFNDIYMELSAYKSGFTNPNRFYAHLNEDAEATFRLMESALKNSGEDVKGATEQGLVDVRRYKDMVENNSYKPVFEVPEEYNEAIEAGIKAQFSTWDNFKGFFGLNDRQNEEFAIDARRNIESWLINKINTGTMFPSTAKDSVKGFIDSHYSVVSGALQYTEGVDPKKLLNTSDPTLLIEEYTNDVLGTDISDYDQDTTQIKFNMAQGSVDITDLSYPESTTIIPFEVLRRWKDIRKFQAEDSGGDVMTTEEIQKLYADPTDEKYYEDLGVQVPTSGVDLSGIKVRTRDISNRDRFQINELNNKARDYFIQYVDKEIPVKLASDADIASKQEWSKMTPVQKVISMNDSITAMQKDTDTIREFLKNRANRPMFSNVLVNENAIDPVEPEPVETMRIQQDLQDAVKEVEGLYPDDTLEQLGIDTTEPISKVLKKLKSLTSTSVAHASELPKNALDKPKPIITGVDESLYDKDKLDEFEQVLGDTKDLVDTTYNNLGSSEGVKGDNTGAAETGARGLTTATYNAMKKKYKKPDMTQKEASKLYIGELASKWSKKSGWSNASKELKVALLDISYNQGEQILGYTGLTNSLADPNKSEADVIKNLFNASNIGGKSSRGIAKRYAKLYNKFTTNKITSIEQKSDGTIRYMAGTTEVYKYKAKNGKHESSKVGTLSI